MASDIFDPMDAVANAGRILGAFGTAGTTAAGLAAGAWTVSAAADAMMQSVALSDLDRVAETKNLSSWQSFTAQRDGWQATIKHHAQMLEMASTASNGTVTVGSVSVQQWCEGYSGATGAVDDLRKVIEQILRVLEPSSSGPLAVLGGVSAMSGSADEPLHALLFAWCQSLYGLVARATFVLNGALALYRRTAQPEPLYFGLGADFIACLRQLGDTQNPPSAWAGIGGLFAGLEAKGLLDDERLCALASHDVAVDMAQDLSRDGTVSLFWAGKTEAPANCYFTNLQLLYFDFPQDSGRIWYLQGTPVQLAADGTRTVLAAMHSLPAGYQHVTDLAAGTYYFNRIGINALAVGAGYVPEPAVPNGNVSNVVTGFTIGSLGSAITIALRFGQLDLSNPARQTITTVDPSYHGATSVTALKQIFFIARDVQQGDLRPTGPQSAYPMTNASFLQMGNRLSLVVRSAWQGYKADMFQPDNLIRYAPPM